MEPHWNAIQQVTASPVLPTRSPHDQLDTHAPEGDLFRQKNPLMRIRLFSWDDGKCAQVPAALSTQSATGLKQQHKPQQQQQQLFEEQSQQRIPQPHMLLQQTLPSQAQQEWTNGGDSVVAPIEFETTLLFKASQPAFLRPTSTQGRVSLNNFIVRLAWTFTFCRPWIIKVC